jgi:hypothetical protein
VHAAIGSSIPLATGPSIRYRSLAASVSLVAGYEALTPGPPSTGSLKACRATTAARASAPGHATISALASIAAFAGSSVACVPGIATISPIPQVGRLLIYPVRVPALATVTSFATDRGSSSAARSAGATWSRRCATAIAASSPCTSRRSRSAARRTAVAPSSSVRIQGRTIDPVFAIITTSPSEGRANSRPCFTIRAGEHRGPRSSEGGILSYRQQGKIIDFHSYAQYVAAVTPGTRVHWFTASPVPFTSTPSGATYNIARGSVRRRIRMLSRPTDDVHTAAMTATATRPPDSTTSTNYTAQNLPPVGLDVDRGPRSARPKGPLLWILGIASTLPAYHLTCRSNVKGGANKQDDAGPIRCFSRALI